MANHGAPAGSPAVSSPIGRWKVSGVEGLAEAAAAAVVVEVEVALGEEEMARLQILVAQVTRTKTTANQRAIDTRQMV